MFWGKYTRAHASKHNVFSAQNEANPLDPFEGTTNKYTQTIFSTQTRFMAQWTKIDKITSLLLDSHDKNTLIFKRFSILFLFTIIPNIYYKYLAYQCIFYLYLHFFAFDWICRKSKHTHKKKNNLLAIQFHH